MREGYHTRGTVPRAKKQKKRKEGTHFIGARFGHENMGEYQRNGTYSTRSLYDWDKVEKANRKSKKETEA